MFCRPQNTQLGSAGNARRGSGDPPGVFCRWLGRENAPHRQYAFGYLDAVREVFSHAPKQHTDPVPEQIGPGPYCRAYKGHVEAGYRPAR